MATTWTQEVLLDYYLTSSPTTYVPKVKKKKHLGLEIIELGASPDSNLGNDVPSFELPVSPPGSPLVSPPPLPEIDPSRVSRRGTSTPPRERLHPPQQTSFSSPDSSVRRLKHQPSFAKLATPKSKPTKPTVVHVRAGPERGVFNGWTTGRMTLTLMGKGGCDGGEIRLFRVTPMTTYQRLAFTHIIPSIDSDDGWSIPDVQFMHHSVSGRRFTLSLRLIQRTHVEDGPNSPHHPAARKEPSQSWQESTSPSPPSSFLASPSSIFPTRKRQPSESRFTFNILPGRSRNRSKTVSVPSIETLMPSPVDKDLPPINRASTRSSASSVSQGGYIREQETHVYLCFKTARERDEWYTVFRSLAKLSSEEKTRLARPHRRLKVGIYDLTEIQSLQPWSRRYGDDSSQTDDVTSAESISSSTRRQVSQTLSTGGKSTQSSDRGRSRSHAIHPGWSWREKIRLELLLDDTLIARTGWIKAADQGGTPFWGENFQFTDLQPFTNCTIHLLKYKKDKAPIVFGKVTLPLVSSFDSGADERYPIRSIHGQIIGEIRLSVLFQEIDVLPVAEYNSLKLGDSKMGSKFLYIMGGRGILEGTMEYLCKIALCDGVLLDRVKDTCSVEATAAGSTLFRSTTPVSKQMEVLLRMLCTDFLEKSLAPTIQKVVADKAEHNLYCSYGDPNNPPINFRVLRLMDELIELTWKNMYDNRHVFPNFMRHVFAHLFLKVKEHHDDGTENELLHYKAVSSFVFLRLIGPALMSPHLFGLADALLPAGAQRTLTLIAKVLHQLAFFSERDLLRHQELSLFKPFVQRNADGMMDFLISIVTPLADQDVEEPISPFVEIVNARRELLFPLLAESIPHLTIAGAIDIGANWAVCTATWYEKRLHPGTKLTLGTYSTEGVESLIAQYDALLDNIHARAFPDDVSPTARDRGVTPSPSRPSLNYSVSTSETIHSSEDLGEVIFQHRRLFDFSAPEKIQEDPVTSPSESATQDATMASPASSIAEGPSSPAMPILAAPPSPPMSISPEPSSPPMRIMSLNEPASPLRRILAMNSEPSSPPMRIMPLSPEPPSPGFPTVMAFPSSPSPRNSSDMMFGSPRSNDNFALDELSAEPDTPRRANRNSFGVEGFATWVLPPPPAVSVDSHRGSDETSPIAPRASLPPLPITTRRMSSVMPTSPARPLSLPVVIPRPLSPQHPLTILSDPLSPPLTRRFDNVQKPESTFPSLPPPPPPPSTKQSLRATIRRKRRPTLPYLFLGRSQESVPPVPPVPSVPVDR